LVFGVFGLWSAFMPIEGASHAPGTVTVKSYKKVVQHLEGGIVRDILVQNGDKVSAGDTLLLIDNTQSLAQLEIINTQLTSQSALEARLIAERDNLDAVNYPDFLTNGDAKAQAEIAGQNQVFQARKTAREGEKAVLEQRIGQLQQQLVGLRAMHDSKAGLAESFAAERQDISTLVDEGFADKQRLRQTERSYEQARGEAAELLANIAATEVQVGETRLQIIQNENRFQTEVADQLAQTQTQLKDIRERVVALSDVVSRTEVKAPDAGIVNNMQVHTIGGVISPGTQIAEIVPESDELVVEAHVNPADIDRVAVGQDATIRFSTFSRKTVPTLDGVVIGVSADSLHDQTTGAQYFLARLELTPESLAIAREDGLIFVPGMPAEVFINSGARTFLQYVMKPFSNALARSFRED
jgi:epimerase transport system membrane fusion protein